MIEADPDPDDTVNFAVTKVSLLFLGLGLYSVDSNDIHERRGVLFILHHYCSLLRSTPLEVQ
jgi:hypothetical protein